MTELSLAAWLERLQHQHPVAIDLGLERVGTVARRLGLLPPPGPVVTVAGTNGKGSTVAVMEALLSAAGHCVGAATSPHIFRFNERIRIAGQEADDSDIVAAFEAVETARGDVSLTYFEVTTLASLFLFRQCAVDITLLEVGLGGRLDAANIVDPSVAVITSIDLDHQEWLGDSREQIALEKGGILRPGIPAVIAERRVPEALAALAESLGTRYLQLGRDFDYQWNSETWEARLAGADGEPRCYRDLPHSALLPSNVCAALQALLALDIVPDADQLPALLATLQPGGRRERRLWRSHELLLDVAHNPAAIKVMCEYLQANPCKGRDFALFSPMADKDIDGMIDASVGHFEGWWLGGHPTLDRAAAVEDVVCSVGLRGERLQGSAETVAAALEAAGAAMEQGDRLVVFGSFYTVAEAMARIDREQGKDRG